MRRFCVTIVIAAGSVGGAWAADLPLPMTPVVVEPPYFTWTGGYIGVNAGYAFNSDSRFNMINGTGSATAVPELRPSFAEARSNGVAAGGQIGYNYQFGQGGGVVIGLEADLAYTALSHTDAIVMSQRLTSLRAGMDVFGTVRGRLGYAFDRILVYGTAGLAYGDVADTTDLFGRTGHFDYTGTHRGFETGYAYGGGVEYALPADSILNLFHSGAVTVRAEFLHYDLGTVGTAVAAIPGNGDGSTGAYTQKIRTDGDLARMGINYKF